MKPMPKRHIIRGMVDGWAATACGQFVDGTVPRSGFCRACARSVLAKQWAKVVADVS
jgi:hypothetical protein